MPTESVSSDPLSAMRGLIPFFTSQVALFYETRVLSAIEYGAYAPAHMNQTRIYW
jgi:hypothetical protein